MCLYNLPDFTNAANTFQCNLRSYLTLQKILHYFPTNIGVFLSQTVHPHHISKVKHTDGYVTTHILCLVINIQIYVVVARPILFFTMLLRAFYDKGGC